MNINLDGVVNHVSGPCEDTCDWCGKQAKWVDGRYGPFIACSAYPKCKWNAKKTRVTATVQKPTAEEPVE